MTLLLFIEKNMTKLQKQFYESISVDADLSGTDPNVKVIVSAEGSEIGTFYFPRTSLERLGENVYSIPAWIIESRCVRDFNVTFDHCTLIPR